MPFQLVVDMDISGSSHIGDFGHCGNDMSGLDQLTSIEGNLILHDNNDLIDKCSQLTAIFQKTVSTARKNDN